MDKIEQRILEIIEQNAEKIIAFGDDIWHHAELGFMEQRTSRKFAEALENVGLSCETGLALTGVRSYLKPQQEGELRIALMGELDALPIADHVDANPETGAAHCCGHNSQLTGVMGAALALTDPQVREALGGNVVFMGVPCEEASTAPEIKQKLLSEGKIASLGGKCEFIRHGIMDDISITVGSHNNSSTTDYLVSNCPSMGAMYKYTTYRGVSQHPAFSHKAVDALSAARLAMNAVDMQREAFNMWEYWNTHLVHGFIAKGGDAMNIVSDNVEVKYNLRAKRTEDLMDMSYRVDRSLRAGAIAVGAGMESRTEPGYLPIVPVKDASVALEVFDLIDLEHRHPVRCTDISEMSGTTDYGDLSNIMPVFQGMTLGHDGQAHNKSFCVADPYEYYVVPAKWYALMAYRLLKDGATCAKKIVAENPPAMTAQEYVHMMDAMKKTEVIEMELAPKARG